MFDGTLPQEVLRETSAPVRIQIPVVSWLADLIIERLEAVERGEIDRITFNLPPQEGKTWVAING